MDSGAENYRRFLNGDRSGMEEIIRDYKDGLILYLNGITGNISLAEELMEETFFKLVTKRPRFSGKSLFKTWLYTIGRNAAIDGMRHRSRYGEFPLDDCRDAEDENCLEHEYIRVEQKIMLHRAMKQLEPDYHQVLYLKYFEDFTNEETARIMHRSKRQIENLLYRAKHSLRSLLVKEGFEYENI